MANKPIYFYIVQGKENNDSADDASTYYYKGNYTRKELERKVLIDYCKDQGIEEKDGKYFLQEYSESEYPIEVSMDIWDIFISDTPISPLLEKEKPMTKKMSEEVLFKYQEWLSKCPIQFHAHGFGSEPTTDNDGKKIKSTDRFMADDDDTHRICEVDFYIPLVDQEEN